VLLLRGFEEMAAKIRPVYCGNFEYDARQSEIERLFKEYGRVDRVDMKTGMSMESMAALLLAVWLRIFHSYMAPRCQQLASFMCLTEHIRTQFLLSSIILSSVIRLPPPLMQWVTA
jgi:hypothetical protein